MTPFTLTRAQVRELDRRAMDEYGIPGIVLMENAGRGCAELLMRLNPEKKDTVILCGPGNNGGDGFVMARHLDNHGWRVAVVFVTDRAPKGGDVAPNYLAATRSQLLVMGRQLDLGQLPTEPGQRTVGRSMEQVSFQSTEACLSTHRPSDVLWTLW